MHFYSETTTRPVKDSDTVDVKFRKNDTHFICVVPWEHSNDENMAVKVTNRPFEVTATASDMLMHRKLKFSLHLTHEILSLEGVFYVVRDKEFHIHIPKANMVKRTKETISIPRKS